VRHILIRGGEKPEDKEKSKKKAQEILDRVKKGEDFAKLAQEFSDDPGSKSKGGVYPGEMVEQFVEPFQKSVAGLKPGDVDQNLVETSFGWHIIKRDPASATDIEKGYKKTKSTDLAKEVANKISSEMKAGKSGADAARAAIAQYGKYTPPKPAEHKPDGGAPATAADGGTKRAPALSAGAGGDGGAGDASAGDGGAASTPAAPTFTASDDPERPQVLSSNAFNRGGDPIPAISGEASSTIVSFAFDGNAGDVIKEPVKTDDGFIIVQIKEKKPATHEDFDKERDPYMKDLLDAKQMEALVHYVKRLRDGAKAEIKIDEANLFGAKTGDGGATVKEEDDEP